MKALQLLAIVLCFYSCSDNSLESSAQFSILDAQNLKFDYYYTVDNIQSSPVNEFKIKLEQVTLNEKDYQGFYDNDNIPTPSFALNTEGNHLDYNFLPIRYQDGIYYEYRGANNFLGFESSSEVIILKDNIKKGDKWVSEVVLNDGEIIPYNFEVIEKYDMYNEFGIDYLDVFQIQETLPANNSGLDGVVTTMHYYNKENGIIRREMPTYISGTYGPIIFNRID